MLVVRALTRRCRLTSSSSLAAASAPSSFMSTSLPTSSTAPPPPSSRQNRLAHETSPYLLQHADNPVDWWPWCTEALEHAKRDNKPIFLSVGYATCHWCHVMAHESFESPATAALMNEHFVNIKVDREERPDIDRVYMTYVQATTGGGGWPMSVWLTPGLQPIMGGTYFPPTNRYGRAGFPAVLKRLADVWRDNHEEVEDHGRHVMNQLLEAQTAQLGSGGTDVAAGRVAACATTLQKRYDAEYGGFGGAPKFPRPVCFDVLFQAAFRAVTVGTSNDSNAAGPAQMAVESLRKMARSGLRDHLGGGWHRYSVDKFWHIPHFEKMLYDQAQMVTSLLNALAVAEKDGDKDGAAEFAAVIDETLAYVARQMTDVDGAFYSAEDADSVPAPEVLAVGDNDNDNDNDDNDDDHKAGSGGDHEHSNHGPSKREGAFYVWSRQEIADVLSDDAETELFCQHYGVEATGNAPPGSDPHGDFVRLNHLVLRKRPDSAATEDRLAASRAKLLAVRQKRERPLRDDKIIVAWNGLMVGAFARAGWQMNRPDYVERAVRACAYIRQQMFDTDRGELRRSSRLGQPSGWGFAADYAAMIKGVLDVYEATGDFAHLQWAVELQAKQDELFLDDAAGGYFEHSGRDKTVLIRTKEEYDGAEPSANSLAALNLARLSSLTGNNDFADQARRTVAVFAKIINRVPEVAPLLCVASDWLEHGAIETVVVHNGTANDAAVDALRAVVRDVGPTLPALVRVDMVPSNREAVATVAPWLVDHTVRDGKPTAYVCRNRACQLPTSDPAELRAQLLALKE